MDKMKLHSPDLSQENIAKIREVFPGCVTEATDGKGNLRLAVDIEKLRQELSDHVIESGQERYQLDWPGKREALFAANAPIAKTLRPVHAESVDFENTQNLFIEGDNLEALKLIQNSYLGAVKLIYIDPPYNRGNESIYSDDYSESEEGYLIRSNQASEHERLVANLESDGRFHSNWLSMIMPRLRVAKRMLRDDGVIVISIGFEESHRLREICDEVFGRKNFLSEVTISTGANQSGEGVDIQQNAEICIIYAKTKDAVHINRIDSVSETLRNLNDAPTSLLTRTDMGFTIYYHPTKDDIEIRFDYDREKIQTNKIEEVYSNDAELISAGYKPIRPGYRNNLLHRWRWGADLVVQRKDQLIFEEKKDGEWAVSFRQFGLNPPKNIWKFSGGASDMSDLFGGDKLFGYPKGIKFMEYIVSLFGTIKDSREPTILMDFFAGSGSFAHGVFSQSSTDGLSRKIINVQYPEELAQKTREQQLVYEACKKYINPINIAEICKERIRRAGRKILKSDCHTDWNKDVGFRVLKIDTSNLGDVYYKPDDVTQENLLTTIDNIKPGRKPEDLLFQVLVDWGVDLTLPIRQENLQGKSVFFVDENAMAACFETGITEPFVKELAGYKPIRVVFRDNGFASDAVKINVEQIFRQISPTTEIRSI